MKLPIRKIVLKLCPKCYSDKKSNIKFAEGLEGKIFHRKLGFCDGCGARYRKGDTNLLLEVNAILLDFEITEEKEADLRLMIMSTDATTIKHEVQI